MVILNLLFSISILLTNNFNDWVSTHDNVNPGSISKVTCNASTHVKNATSQLTKDGYRFLKQYSLVGSSSRKQFSQKYVCTAGQIYLVRFDAAGGAGDVYVTIKDASGKEITTNYVEGSYKKGAGFLCGKTAQYEFIFKFTGSSYCAGAALGYNRP